MEQTKVEQSYEKLLAELSMPFRDRMYFDELELGAQIDDVNMTGKEIEELLEPFGLFGKLLADDVKSYTQLHIENGAPFVFVRHSGVTKGFGIEYSLSTKKQEHLPRDKVPSLIQEKRYNDENIMICINGEYSKSENETSIDFYRGFPHVCSFVYMPDGKVTIEINESFIVEENPFLQKEYNEKEKLEFDMHPIVRSVLENYNLNALTIEDTVSITRDILLRSFEEE